MSGPAPFRQGDIRIYPYLSRWQAARGETGGRKDRPVCVALPLRKNDVTHLFLLAITSTRPAADRIALEIPEIEARRGGLKGWKQGWVLVDECNYDIAERSFHFDRTEPVLGRFSETFTECIKAELRVAIGAGTLRQVDRTAD